MSNSTPIASLAPSTTKPANGTLARPWWSRVRYSPSRYCLGKYWESHWSLRWRDPAPKPLRPLLAVIGPHLNRQRLMQVSIRYRTFRKYMKFLLRHWSRHNLAARIPFAITGETHLRRALANGRGAVLIAPHNYGFSRFTVPILVRRGYSCARVGSVAADKIDACWGAVSERSWEYLSVGSDPFRRIRALRRMKQLLERNTVVHLLVPNRRDGDSNIPVDLYGHGFFLQAATFELLAELGSEVLPCFTLSDNHGRLLIDIGACLPGHWSDAAEAFAAGYNRHLRELPEFITFWESLTGDAVSW
jgi:lauroyl/myristoyl acyltransferase